MSIATVLAIIALVLALISEFQAAGKSLLGWAVVMLALIHLLGVLH